MRPREALAGALRRRRPPVARSLSRQDAARLPDRRSRAITARQDRAAVQGQHRLVRRSSTPQSTRSPRRCGASASARATASRCCCPTARSSSIAEFGAWKTGAVVVGAESRPTASASSSRRSTSTRAETVVALTPFYERVKRVQGRTGVEQVIATSIKEYLPPVLRVLFTLFKEKKDGHRITLAAGRSLVAAICCARTAARRGPR